jgi:hypothetical protein
LKEQPETIHQSIALYENLSFIRDGHGLDILERKRIKLNISGGMR